MVGEEGKSGFVGALARGGGAEAPRRQRQGSGRVTKGEGRKRAVVNAGLGCIAHGSTPS